MYKLILLFLFVFSYAFEIDTSIENNLSSNDIASRNLLVHYYFDKNLTKAIKYNDEILQIDKSSKLGAKNKKKIALKLELNKITKNQNIDKYYQNLYFANDYETIKKMDKYLSVISSDYPKLITARIYLWDGKYKKVKNILKLVKDKTNYDYVDLKAYICFYEGNYKCSKKGFSILFSATAKLDYAYRLIDSLIYLGEIDRANKLLIRLLKSYPNNKKLKEYQQKIIKKQNAQKEKLYKQYEKTHKFEDLQKLLGLLFLKGDKKEAYKLLEEYIKAHPSDSNAKYWYATYLSWDGNNKKAIEILENIVTQSDYKVKLLMAKIYSWDADYIKALNYANDIITNSNNKELILDAKELKGLIYYWQQNYDLAKPLLEEVLKQKNSQTAKEALMVINGNLKPLIKKYKKLYKNDISNLDYILRIAEYSEKLGDKDTAIKFYELYFNSKPNLNIAHKLGMLYLEKKNYYKAFSFYEYWAYKKGDCKSLYELAQKYYYAGYSKSALNVIKDILAIKQYKPALALKAKILRYSPKFTQNNDSKTINDVFKEKNSKLLEVGNRLYFNGFYHDASKYYKEYMLSNPNDAEIRERYAYSLEFSSDYQTAMGEFFLLTWSKKTCNILYHYGFSLEKSGKKKLAKQVYNDGLKMALKPAPKFIDEFINNWKKAWESQNVNKYKSFYDEKYRKNKIWVIRKDAIFRNVKFISIYIPEDIALISQNDDIYKIKFFQQYSTNKKVDKGYKTLTLRCIDKKCVITKEYWQKGEYIPNDYKCEKLINLRLKNIDKTPTLMLDLKKKIKINSQKVEF